MENTARLMDEYRPSQSAVEAEMVRRFGFDPRAEVELPHEWRPVLTAGDLKNIERIEICRLGDEELQWSSGATKDEGEVTIKVRATGAAGAGKVVWSEKTMAEAIVDHECPEWALAFVVEAEQVFDEEDNVEYTRYTAVCRVYPLGNLVPSIHRMVKGAVFLIVDDAIKTASEA